MTLTLFATADEVEEADVTVDPDKVDRYIRSATLIVARACNINPYADYVIPPDSMEPLKDAVCAQIESWVVLKIDPAALGLDAAPVKKSTMLGAAVERDTSGQLAALQSAAAKLAPEAEAVLQTAELLWFAVPTAAGADVLIDYGLGSGQVSIDSSDRYWWETCGDWPFV